MTMQEAEDAVEVIAADDEPVSHMREDELRERFIRHVAETTSGELAKMARLVLTTSAMDFARCYG